MNETHCISDKVAEVALQCIRNRNGVSVNMLSPIATDSSSVDSFNWNWSDLVMTEGQTWQKNLITKKYREYKHFWYQCGIIKSRCWYCAFKCLRACSVTSSSFLFHSTAFMRQLHSKPITACSWRSFFFISSFTYTTI